MKRVVPAALILVFILFLPSYGAAEAIYFVKEGDTLSGIAAVFHATIDELKSVNRLSSDAIKPGDQLRIPEHGIKTAFTPSIEKAARPKAVAPVVPAPAAEASPTPAAAAAPAEPEKQRCKPTMLTHSVKRGDNPWNIAVKYGVSLNDLLRQNGLNKSSILSIGRQLTVKSTPRVYEVEQGDNLWSLASRFGVPAGNLRKLNELEGDALVPGQALYLDACREEPVEASADRYGPFPLESEVQEALGITPPEQIHSLTQRLVAFAETMLNVPYRFGGSTLKGIDCSAFTQRAFSFLNISLPRTTYEQFKLGEAVDRDQLAAGDLVFFQTWARGASHVGIYLGGDKFIHASSGGRRAVTYSTITDPYYAKRFMGARRLLFEGEETLPAAQPASKL